MLTGAGAQYADQPTGPTRRRRARLGRAARGRLAELDVSDDALAPLQRRRDAARDRGRRAWPPRCPARRGRPTAAGEAVTGELAGLAMAGARVAGRGAPRAGAARAADAGIDPSTDGRRRRSARHRGRRGRDRCCAPHPDAPALPLGRGASGGELSRVMLAIEVCLAGTDPVPTMVFDEVDAGVGGRAAAEVGRRLARLARDHQVIVVTHLAQVAAFADRHIVVRQATAR